MPRRDQADAVLAALDVAQSPMSTAALETAVDVRRARLELLLKVLDVDGAVSRVQGGWVATGRPWTYDEDRYARVRQAREHEQDLMLEYQSTSQCRMAFLQHALDDPGAQRCGKCDRCAQPWYSTDVATQAALAAQAALHRPGVTIEPRAMWPAGMDKLGVEAKGRIPPESQLRPGRAVARLTDLGWGNQLREFFSGPDGEVPEQLTGAVVKVLAAWDWQRRPGSVVAVPSRSRPRTVQALARGIAHVGRLDFLGTLDLVDGGPVGQRGGNSAYRLAGLWQRFAAGPDLAASLAATTAPVLLVDDLVDSRWTLTVAGEAVRSAGASEVLPFALARVG
jgi:ATP-dependent DNA helicase RecQ